MHRLRFWELRAVVLTTAFTYLVTGMYSWSYPATYLPLARVWALIFFTAGGMALATLFFRKMWLAVASGGLLIGAALFRAFAMYARVGPQGIIDALESTGGPQRDSTFTIGATAWLLVAVLLWVGWPQVQAMLIGEGKDGAS